METPKVFESEYKFCLILWEHEPIKSSELVNLCSKQLGWKPTTTYTVIKRLSDRGVLKNENATVSSLVSKEDVQASELENMVENDITSIAIQKVDNYSYAKVFEWVNNEPITNSKVISLE